MQFAIELTQTMMSTNNLIKAKPHTYSTRTIIIILAYNSGNPSKLSLSLGH